MFFTKVGFYGFCRFVWVCRNRFWENIFFSKLGAVCGYPGVFDHVEEAPFLRAAGRAQVSIWVGPGNSLPRNQWWEKLVTRQEDARSTIKRRKVVAGFCFCSLKLSFSKIKANMFPYCIPPFTRRSSQCGCRIIPFKAQPLK